MENKRKRLQRGAADLVSVAVGMTLLAIAAVGTSYSLLYGRQALIHQEHFKAATYVLRGELERETARFQLLRGYRGSANSYTNFTPLDPFNLDSPNDREGDVNSTFVEITRDRVEAIDLFDTGVGTDYYRIVMRAKWQEAVYAGYLGGRTRDKSGPEHEILLASTFVIPGES